MEKSKHFHTDIKDLPQYKGMDVPVAYRQNAVIGNSRKTFHRVMVGIPTTGLVRMEWVISRYGQVIPCNWSQTDTLQWLDQHSPIDFLVADARNICVHHCLNQGFEWLFFIDHDTVMPPFTILAMNERMLKGEIPLWSGLYFTKSKPSEPLLYRGSGTGYYTDWKLGDKVWVDGLPMGCTMIHHSLLVELAKQAEPYEVRPGMTIRKIFETPAKVWFDPELRSWFTYTGTEDLQFCSDILEKGILKKAGWDEVAEKEYPFLVDTNLFCRHIDQNGTQYPLNGEEFEFMTDKQKEAMDAGKIT